MSPVAAFLLAASAPQPAAPPPRAVAVGRAVVEIVRAERVAVEPESGAAYRTVRQRPQGAEIAFE